MKLISHAGFSASTCLLKILAKINFFYEFYFSKLISSYNWFRDPIGLKKNTAYWRGVYHCDEINCSRIYNMSIWSVLPGDIVARIEIEFSGNTNDHPVMKKDPRQTGNMRCNIGLAVLAKGVPYVKHQHELNNILEGSFKK